MTPQTIERILSLGGGVSINSGQYTPLSLERFAMFVAQANSTLILRDASKLTPLTMERIAAASNGKVIFEFN